MLYLYWCRWIVKMFQIKSQSIWGQWVYVRERENGGTENSLHRILIFANDFENWVSPFLSPITKKHFNVFLFAFFELFECWILQKFTFFDIIYFFTFPASWLNAWKRNFMCFYSSFRWKNFFIWICEMLYSAIVRLLRKLAFERLLWLFYWISAYCR